jgi:signal transduction histidine kinase
MSGIVTGVAVGGWLATAALMLAAGRLRRRLELVAEAAHELRGAAGALAYAAAWLRREPGGVRLALRFEAELERMRAGLGDLDAARLGRRAAERPRTIELDRLVVAVAAGWRSAVAAHGRTLVVLWDAGPTRVRADRGQLAQALGNLLANAVEHGSGAIEVAAVRRGRTVRVEVRDGGRAAARSGRGAPGGARRLAARRFRLSPRDRGRGLRIAARAVHTAGGRLTLERGPRGTVAAVELPLAGAVGAAREPRGGVGPESCSDRRGCAS